ncbi:hypothetical protein ACTFIY_007902 [Dictyostelium cf. discoideum]
MVVYVANKDQVLEIQTSISQLYCKGYNVNFNCSNQTKSLDFKNTEYKKLSDVLFNCKNEYRVSFHYKYKKTNKWSLSCSGRISTTKHNDEVLRKMDIEKLKAKCNSITIQKKELYETIKYNAQLTFEGKVLKKLAMVIIVVYQKTHLLISIDLSKINNNSNDNNENNTINESFDDVDQILPFIHKKGIDLIINTLPFEFLYTNFLLLGQGGRIVDLSVNHLNNNDTTDFSKFKWFIGYSIVEIFYNGFEKLKHILQLIIDMIKNKELPLIPIKEYPINQIKDAIEFIGQRKYIVLRDGCSNLVQDTIKSLEKDLKNNYLVASPDFKFMGDSLGKTILLTGQTGLSLSIIQMCLLNNYQDLEGIIVISKSPIKNELQYLISFAKNLSRKTRIHFKQADCSKIDEISKAIYQKFITRINIP